MPSLLNSVLRAAVSQTDLPFAAKIKLRHFPIPAKKLSVDDFSNAIEYYGEDLYQDELSTPTNESQLQQLSARKLEMLSKLQSFCPEESLSESKIPEEDECPIGNIRVRHVQPMAAGKHIVCRNVSAPEPDMQSRKSMGLLRKAFFEQTYKIFQPYKGLLVYDLMDDTAFQNYETSDVYGLN